MVRPTAKGRRSTGIVSAKRDRVIQFRLSAQERDAFRNEAERVGLTMSQWLLRVSAIVNARFTSS